MKKVIISFGVDWNTVRVAVNTKDLQRTLETIEGLEFVDSHYDGNKLSWYNIRPRRVEIELADEVLPQRPADTE